MQKEVLIHVRGLQMMDAQGDKEPMKPLNLRSIT